MKKLSINSLSWDTLVLFLKKENIFSA